MIVREKNPVVLRQGINIDIRSYTMVIALLAIWIVFAVLTKGNFLTPRNLSMLMRQVSITSILAVGMVLVIVAGHIDLSVGSVSGFTGAVLAVLQLWYHWSTIPSILAALFVGLVIGAWQGFWVAYRGVPAFIVTLSSMLVFRGGILLVTKGVTISPLRPEFKIIGQGYIPSFWSIIMALAAVLIYIYMTLNNRKSRLKYGLPVTSWNIEIMKMIGTLSLIAVFIGVMIAYQGIPIPVIIVLFLVVLFTFIANNTTFGRYVYAIGGNREAAVLSGINIKKTNMTIFLIMGLLSALAGIVLTSRLDAATTSAGNLFELDAIASAIIGGTSTLGGEGTIPGAVIGALVMASIDNGMSLLNIDYSIQIIVKGLVLVLAVWIDIATRKRTAY
ncbi:sugar ABC transporter permease [Thermosediminibacter litoriperuensis]|uniref:Xylose transport system permease protein XylH n=1 Tax=Thermosediminibacter litoriperuensis TaxID=291989 RepID=A0A5S5AV52_9FIRM|nr:sugar ABC transporter permease [Thermosediminibacter litoriperuensis]TYP56776.1 xylose ABC transporter membrane protein [Thermosediminibacter litoriperuensis]